MSIVRPLRRSATFCVPQFDLTNDALCAQLKMPPLHAAAKREAKIQKAADQAGLRVGSPRLCLPIRLCGNCGCHRCRRMFQEAFIRTYAPFLYRDAWRELIAKLKKAKRPVAITIVPLFGKVPVGGYGMDLKKFINTIRKLLRRLAPKAKGFFFVDVSQNEPKRGKKGYWQVHVHGVIWKLSEKAKSRLKAALKSLGKSVHKPLLTKHMDDPVGWLAYMAKPNFFRRINTVEEDGGRNITGRPLPPEQEVSIARWLSRYKVGARFFTIGLGHDLPTSTSITL
ncbi:hypothetical protein [Rubellimicrobium roseum]|uniref:Replication protein n=1 Tax=Rubellimicrobium roseum TaxID=687525 RepID=A0A5C4N910_9RHOB|nr:hypothetical protein [Rubellimicrobium roseum]TNC66555.1 hypothetical protein FHG71_16335 [Rubellimicrobium roseum]